MDVGAVEEWKNSRAYLTCPGEPALSFKYEAKETCKNFDDSENREEIRSGFLFTCLLLGLIKISLQVIIRIYLQKFPF